MTQNTTNQLVLKWETPEETGLMNHQPLLAIDDWGNYQVGKLINGEFYVLDRLQRNGHRKIGIVKYAELPDTE